MSGQDISIFHMVTRHLFPICLLALMVPPASAQAPAAPAPKVSIAAAWSEEITREAKFIGRGEAAAKTDLVAQVAGAIVEVLIEDGALVEQGDIIFRIEPDSYLADVAANRASVTRAEANVRLAEIELDRKKELVSRGTAPESELDIARANASVAEADLLAAQAALHTAEINLSRTEITAPFGGRIGRTNVSLGAVVGPTAGALATLVKESPMYVTFSLSEPQLLGVLEQLDTGIDQLIESDRSPNVFIELPDQTMLDEPGAIVFLDNQINASTGTISIRAQFENKRRIILDGGFLNVIIEELEPVLSVLIPQNSVQRDQRGDFVLVVTDKQLVEQRYVQLGIQLETAVVVEDGLRPGESVIVEGLQRVRPGVEVNAVLTGTAGGN
ncbi:efflux RND transporter periplasmic adaptor subunit [Pelagimonas varians]|uniref:Efflux pump periplasmic linker BepF n=1 Tax=Pelagimonas varians TaxID=696760 RepID=A0A238KV72_9RHOB|nr:efflux RND transporter periplasmic adaptor subunit [Pelagimonas varians]PYG28098.1 membrane fusion protein (multidrug efflux system) [Pelagimonas varians]SMX46744.1 Efflux pump periplasmic linker BepF [Pelagimonas varians]